MGHVRAMVPVRYDVRSAARKADGPESMLTTAWLDHAIYINHRTHNTETQG